MILRMKNLPSYENIQGVLKEAIQEMYGLDQETSLLELIKPLLAYTIWVQNYTQRED